MYYTVQAFFGFIIKDVQGNTGLIAMFCPLSRLRDSEHEHTEFTVVSIGSFMNKHDKENGIYNAVVVCSWNSF